MAFDYRRVAVVLTGYCAFINLYSPQALLPELAREFGAGPAAISNVMTAGTLAIALTAPFTGAVADVLGRKRVITAAMVAVSFPMAMVALAPDVQAVIVWRFIQGLLIPPIFAVAVAYIGDEWPINEVPGVAGLYVFGASFGGFSGRMIPGLFADLVGWRAGFLVLAAMTLVAAGIVALTLTPEKNFVRSQGLAASVRQMVQHLRNPQLLATFAVGFGVLFNFLVTFTYVGFHLAAPPYRFSNTMLGAVFATYLVGSASAPLSGRAIAWLGRRGFMFLVFAAWACGALLMLAPPLPAIILGLVLCAGCGLMSQAVSTGYVMVSAKGGRSSAIGLYATAFYVGGSVGAALGGVAWIYGHWPACVALIVVMVAIMALIVGRFWTRTPPR